jgi:hypothetical protein
MSQRHASHIRPSLRARPLRCRSICLLHLRRQTRLHPRLHLQLELGAGHIYGVPKGLESIACASTRTETGRCILRRRKAGTHRRAELYRTGIGAWTRFAGIFIALVSAMTVASRSCPKLSTAPTITRTAYSERFRFGRLAHVPARTTASCTRLPCVPERCAHLQTMCTHMLCTPFGLSANPSGGTYRPVDAGAGLAMRSSTDLPAGDLHCGELRLPDRRYAALSAR